MPEDGDKATLGFVVANAALGSDKDTIVFLSADGVWAAVKGEAEKVIVGPPFAPLKDLLDKFRKRRQDPRLRAVPEEARDRRGAAGPRREARRRRGAGRVAVERLPLRELLSAMADASTGGPSRRTGCSTGATSTAAPASCCSSASTCSRCPRAACSRCAAGSPPWATTCRPGAAWSATSTSARCRPGHARYFVRRGGDPRRSGVARDGQGERPRVRVAGEGPVHRAAAEHGLLPEPHVLRRPAGELRGEGRAPSAVELLLGALAATWRSFATACARDGSALDDVEVSVKGRLAHPLARLGLGDGDPSFAARSSRCFATTFEEEERVRAAWKRRSPARRSARPCEGGRLPRARHRLSWKDAAMFTVTQVGSWPRSREILRALRDRRRAA